MVPQQPGRKGTKPYLDDYEPYNKPQSRSPLKGQPKGTYDSPLDKYSTYKTETTTETSYRKTSPERYHPRDDSPGKRTSIKTTATLNLSSSKTDSLLRRSPEKPSSLYDRKSPEKQPSSLYDRKSPEKTYGKPGSR